MPKLIEIEALKEGWDGYGCGPISKAALETATRFEASWVPMSDGGLLLDIMAGDRHLEIEIGEDGKIASVALFIE